MENVARDGGEGRAITYRIRMLITVGGPRTAVK